MALGAFSILALSLLPLALAISSKGYPLYSISKWLVGLLLTRSPQFRSRLYYRPFCFYK